MGKIFDLSRAVVAALLLISLTGCLAIAPPGLPGLPGLGGLGHLGPVRGWHHSSRVTDVMRGVGIAMAIVATVKIYIELNAAQRARVESIVARRYERQLAEEKRALAPKYAARKSQVKRKSQAHVVQVRSQSPSQAARLEAEAARELAQVDDDWQQAAAASVQSKYGSDYAVPVRNPDGKPVVAFASVKGGQVRVASSAYEVGGGVKEGSKVKHAGRSYAVVSDKISL